MKSLATCPLRYKALIFDCDGVLVDSEPLHAETWAETLRRHGLDITVDDMMRFIGVSSPDMLSILIDEEKVFDCRDRQGLMREKRELYLRRMEEGLDEIPGADEFLRAMAPRVSLALATGNVEPTYRGILRLMNWSDLFQVTVGVDDVERSKPEPDIYLCALRKLGLAARDCVVFEDSGPGIRAARAANLAVIGVSTSQSRDFLLSQGAYEVVPDFRDERTLCSAVSHPA